MLNAQSSCWTDSSAGGQNQVETQGQEGLESVWGAEDDGEPSMECI